MKNDPTNIFILHSLNGDTLRMWGADVKEVFEAKGIEVIMPKFPIREKSRYEQFKEILLPYVQNNQLTKHTIVIAHSIGNPYFIRFCKELNFIPKAYIAVAPRAIYEGKSDRIDYTVDVMKQSWLKRDALDFMKQNVEKIYCLYSDESVGKMDEFTRFIKDTNACAMYLKCYDHFDGYHRIYKIPELNDLLTSLLKEGR